MTSYFWANGSDSWINMFSTAAPATTETTDKFTLSQ